ncbi:putative dioxygenase alpha subunit [Octadecabacter arcticus 238]|jgi:phenylpropionate dioxygenase-like ring-hydroxylating dioxygenase large terminal subunit|uniref:Putative dioxygenase alpha subunit n=1 Tax=Octadecabacter arcticus 238 TaxID=391616 RepID=M9RQB9_9RHOB|nr:aromatic ring-hydroxylating dioxygenase subunit alpha [Octadecabacter arcticus]AGI74372.1 putative dioxygenase alpha subunit [Octadecabacter arcticus 238]
MGKNYSPKSHKDLTWDYSDPVNGQTIPAPFFYDADIFEQEKERIFMECWHLVGHVNEFKEPGSFIVQDIFEQSVVVTNEKDGNIHAWHNVCRHRGNRLMNERRGKVGGVLRCPYHSWCYNLDGGLRAAPRTEHLDNFSKEDYSLRKVRMEIFAGWVFITLDEDAQPVAEMAAGAEEIMRKYMPDMDDVELVEETDVIVYANWKVIQENAVEGYHFDLSGPVHKDLAALIDFKGYTLTAYDKYWTYIGPPNKEVTHAYGLPLEGATWQTDSFFNIGLWPNTSFYSFPYTDMVGVFIMIPLTPEKSLLRFSYYAPKGREMPEVTKAAIEWMNKDLGPEDIVLNETNQKGLHSIGFGSGRYLIDDSIPNQSEHLVFNFHKLCYQAIRE